ncbi:hypothetical protein EU522_00355 [Candidatus Thorarchaeota archaeon]|nr:MAG: hypothetical protein EU522_00355 [Candidatus Thorarchaeota archaeon]
MVSRLLAVASAIGIVASAILTMIAWGLWSSAVRATFDTLMQFFVIIFIISLPLGMSMEVMENQHAEDEGQGLELA